MSRVVQPKLKHTSDGAVAYYCGGEGCGKKTDALAVSLPPHGTMNLLLAAGYDRKAALGIKGPGEVVRRSPRKADRYGYRGEDRRRFGAGLARFYTTGWQKYWRVRFYGGLVECDACLAVNDIRPQPEATPQPKPPARRPPRTVVYDPLKGGPPPATEGPGIPKKRRVIYIGYPPGEEPDWAE